MYIIVSGGGNVGYGIALELQQLPDYEVTIVELSANRASSLRDEIGDLKKELRQMMSAGAK